MRSVVLILALLTMECACTPRFHAAFDLPGVMLWAWQRPEDLRFIDTHTTGVAFLAGTARISANGFSEFVPRLQPLKIEPGTPLLTVVRIESNGPHAVVQTERLVHSLSQVMHTPGIRGLQIDFDARASERGFYRSLLQALRAQSPVPVGVTALASWCEGDQWLDRADVVEAVPMFFRMGRDETRNIEITSGVCSSSIGLSTDEAWPVHRPLAVRRIYVFSPRAWNRESYIDALGRIASWK